MGFASEAAFAWDALIDGELNGRLRVKRTVSVEDGHMVALPEESQEHIIHRATRIEGEPESPALEGSAHDLGSPIPRAEDTGGADLWRQQVGAAASQAGGGAETGSATDSESSSIVGPQSYVQVRPLWPHGAGAALVCEP